MYQRRELPGHPVKVTERRETIGPFPVVHVIWDGPHIVHDGTAEYLTRRSILHDGGEMGVGLTFLEGPTENEAWDNVNP